MLSFPVNQFVVTDGSLDGQSGCTPSAHLHGGILELGFTYGFTRHITPLPRHYFPE